MKALVTGSTGLLGSNLVRTLLAAGWEVRALARSRAKAQTLLGDTAAEIVVGDMENVAGFAPPLQGVDVVFHTAAYFREYYAGVADHWATLQRINIDATLELLAAAEQAGVRHFVHTSSSGVYGKSERGDERTPPDAYVEANLYFRSKLYGDRALAERAPALRLQLTTIHPVAMLGPGDSGPTGLGQTIIAALNNALPAIPAGGVSVVDARDVAAAMLASVTKGRHGEHYLVAHSFQTLPALLGMIRREAGLPPLRTMPVPVAMLAASAAETAARITGRPPLVTREAIQVLQRTGTFSMAKAQRELGATVRPLEHTLRDEIRWFVEHGAVTGATLPTIQRALAADPV